jgi:hypothetical protein
MNEKYERYFTCDCSYEILKVQKDTEGDLVYFSIYKQDSKRSLFQKLKFIWGIITTGEPYEDQIVLNTKNAKELAKFLDIEKRSLNDK